MVQTVKLLTVAAAALVVIACQSPAPHESLEHARSVYQLTRSDPRVAQHAEVELTLARQTLRSAERAWADTRDDSATRALARLAVRQVEQARSAAEAQADTEADEPPPLLEANAERGGSPARAWPQPLSPAQQVRLTPAR